MRKSLASHLYRVLRMCGCWRRRKENTAISSRNESYEAYTGNSLQAAGRVACSLSNSAPKSDNAVVTHLTLWQPTLMQSSLARLHQTVGVQERGTEKETCFRTSETRIPPWPTGKGHNQSKEGCLSLCQQYLLQISWTAKVSLEATTGIPLDRLSDTTTLRKKTLRRLQHRNSFVTSFPARKRVVLRS